jgi:hypothetical protein
VEQLWAMEGHTERVLRSVDKEPSKVTELVPYHEGLKDFYRSAPQKVARAYEILEARRGVI